MCLSAVMVTTSTSPSARASSKCSRWPMCTRSNAPWQSTIVLFRSSLRRRGKSDTGTIFGWRRRAGSPAGGAEAAGVRVSLMTPPLERHEQSQRLGDVDEVLHAKRLALALLALDQIHGDFEVRA